MIQTQRSGTRILSGLLWFLLVLFCLDSYGPFSFFMPSTGLDPSWSEGMNQAFSQHLLFGHDIVFTYGPYASIFTRVYHPAVFWPITLGSLCFALFFAAGLWLITDRRPWSPLMIGAWLLLLPIAQLDVYYFSFVMLMFLVVYKRIVLAPEKGPSTPILLAALFCLLGLMPLMKGTLIVLVFLTVAASILLMLLHRRWLEAAIALLAPIASMLFFWKLSGVPLAGLKEYFHSMGFIVQGYSEAMERSGSLIGLLFCLLITLLLLFTACRISKGTRLDRAIMLLTLTAYLFLSFKAGFVRQDGHILITYFCIALAGLMLSLLFEQKRQKQMLAVAMTVATIAILIASSPIYSSHMNHEDDAKSVSLAKPVPAAAGHLGLLSKLRQSVKSGDFSWLGRRRSPYRLHPWHFGPAQLDAAWERASAKTLRLENVPFSIVGDLDVYNFEQAADFAGKWPWNPRPVLQSYSVYTPELVAMNEHHLRTTSAPGNLLFSLETIDNRFPSLDDGASWPAMLDNYQIANQSPRWILLKRRAGPLKSASAMLPLGSHSARIDERIPVPRTTGPLFVSLSIEPSTLGKLEQTFFKLPELDLHIRTADGGEASYRVVSGMMKTGFLLSPVVSTNADFVHLYNPAAPWSADKQVTTIWLSAGHRSWRSRFTLSFTQYLAN